MGAMTPEQLTSIEQAIAAGECAAGDMEDVCQALREAWAALADIRDTTLSAEVGEDTDGRVCLSENGIKLIHDAAVAALGEDRR